MKHLILVLLMLTAGNGLLQAADFYHFSTPRTYKFRVSLTDKKNNSYSIKHPEAFLSKKSIDRRKRMGLKVDQFDLPITTQYLQEISKIAKVVTKSKWNNSVVIETSDTTITLSKVKQLPFVKDLCRVWIRRDSMPVPDSTKRQSLITNHLDTLTTYYGSGQTQIEQLNGIKLHNNGLTGEGVTIAIIDGGFCNADLVAGLNQTKILGTHDFVRPWRTVYEGQKHGMNVLSTIAANVPYSFVGTAPKASFYLLVSEDDSTEHKIEEDYWCEAVEYADSVGCDMITSSLGYNNFEDKTANVKYENLDGRTEANSKVAGLAASRGILVLNSAGNSGNDIWKKLGVPGDAPNIITVGAVDSQGINTNFSSLGNTADHRIKPDVMALGKNAAIFDTNGQVAKANGTSFSTPIMCGLTACLCQAFPKTRPEIIIRAIQMSSNNYKTPNNIFGYGIPDMWKAYELLKTWKH